MITRTDLETRARALYTEAIAFDPDHVDAVICAVGLPPVFVWTYLTVRELRALCLALAPTALRARS